VKNAQEMLDHLAEFAKTAFEERGEVVPMWIVQGPNDLVPIVTPFGDGGSEEKDAIHAFVRAKAKEINAHVVGFISEAWMVTRGARDNLDKPPSECADRIEVIQVMAEDRNRAMVGQYLIHRPDGEKPYLSPFEIKDGKFSGRFVGSLEKFNA
jgi:hypothetical protein